MSIAVAVRCSTCSTSLLVLSEDEKRVAIKAGLLRLRVRVAGEANKVRNDMFWCRSR